MVVPNMPFELFDIVDENDIIIDRASREDCHTNHLIHRSVMFFVFDEEGRVLVTKRTHVKAHYTGILYNC